MEFLIQKGVDLETTNVHGQTALMVAASEGHGQIVRLLGEAKALVNARDDHGRTALMLIMGESRPPFFGNDPQSSGCWSPTGLKRWGRENSPPDSGGEQP